MRQIKIYRLVLWLARKLLTQGRSPVDTRPAYRELLRESKSANIAHDEKHQVLGRAFAELAPG